MTKTATQKNDGFTIMEVVLSLALSTVLFLALMSTYMGIKSLNSMCLAQMQAMQIVRGQMERVRGMAFANIVDDANVVPYDAGDDLVWGTADDKTGTLSVEVRDAADMDCDGDTDEAWIDVNGAPCAGGANDTVARPVRVAFNWNQTVLGQRRNRTMTADTLVGQ